jgi:hypothetical protein
MRHASQLRALWTAAVGVPLLGAAIVGLQMRIDARTRTLEKQSEELLLRSPSAIKKMSLGYDPLLADIYWTRAVQYYGKRIGNYGARFDLLWPLLDITTTLDPHLVVTYRFGAVFLSEPVLGAGRTDLAIELVKRGIAANPGEWQLNADLGFLYYWKLRDYQASAAAYLEGGKKPHAPSWLTIMGARILQKGGSIETSRMIWSEIYESNQNPAIREHALQMLRGLKAQEDEMHLDEIAAAYKQRFGRYPQSSAELRSAGLLTATPVDPLGFPYVFGTDGKSKLNPASTVVIPTAPKTPPTPSH